MIDQIVSRPIDAAKFLRSLAAVAALTVPLHALANPDEDLEALCKLAYSKIDLGKALKAKGTEQAGCIGEVEKEVNLLAKDPEFLAPVANRKFDKRVFLYMTIGGTALNQCLAPRTLSYEEYRADGCATIRNALPLK